VLQLCRGGIRANLNRRVGLRLCSPATCQSWRRQRLRVSRHHSGYRRNSVARCRPFPCRAVATGRHAAILGDGLRIEHQYSDLSRSTGLKAEASYNRFSRSFPSEFEMSRRTHVGYQLGAEASDALTSWQSPTAVKAHIFVVFLAYCLHVSLRTRLRPLAPGLSTCRFGQICRHPNARCALSDDRRPHRR